jgi:uncharacterized protein (DUF934 family)
MPLLDRNGFKTDAFTRVEGDTPATGNVILPLERLAQEGDAILASGRKLGVHIANTVRLQHLAPWLEKLSLVSIGFPAFSDGRGFSLAKQLRWQGVHLTLRATGPLVADQFAYALACGFDEIEVPDAIASRQPATHWLNAKHAISSTYQRGYGGATILDQRRQARATHAILGDTP